MPYGDEMIDTVISIVFKLFVVYICVGMVFIGLW